MSPEPIYIWLIPLPETTDRRSLRRYVEEASRSLLAQHVSLSPESVTLGRSDRGRPHLTGDAISDLHISLAHSGDAALLAVARGRPIGVDLERVRPLRAPGRLAKRFLDSTEAENVISFGGGAADRGRRFLDLWVRKEAYLKGVSGSVPVDLRRFGLSTTEAGSTQVRWTELEEDAASPWQIRDLALTEDYVGAVAVEGAISQIVLLAQRETSERLRGART